MRRDRLVVVGNGMVGHRFVDALRSRDKDRRWGVTILGEEPRPAYDRVALSSWFTGTSADELTLDVHCYDDVLLRLGERADAVDRAARVVTTSSGDEVPYDALVLAT